MKVPSNDYFQKIKQILYKEILLKNKSYEFNNLRRAIYGNENIIKLLEKSGLTMSQISSGVSDRKAYKGYLKQITSDMRKNRYYRDYFSSKGNSEARIALSLYESLKLDKNRSYIPEDFCLTEGSTGAISMFFEYVKKNYKDSEILIQSPNYYLYKFAAQYYNIKLNEVMTEINPKKPSFISIDLLIKNFTEDTKVIILTNPANPSGEIFSYKDLKKLLLAAKEKNILVLIDELFAELVFDPEKYTYSDSIASEIDAMNNLVIVKGFSKSKNLVGLRIGYIYSKNRKIIDEISLISQMRSSFSVASNFTGLICLDAFIQSVRWESIYAKSRNYKQIVKRMYKDFKVLSTIKEKKYEDLIKEYEDYQNYFNSLMQFYSQTFDQSLILLASETASKFPKLSAFNTIVKIKDLEKVNSLDFMINCFFTTGLKTEIGPCFGLSQKTWDEKLGFWLRITFAQDNKKLMEGIRKFVEFKKLYIQNPKKFLNLGLSF